MSKTIGQEVMRTEFANSEVVRSIKESFATLYTRLVNLAGKAQEDAHNNVPSTLAASELAEYLDGAARKAEETMRCMSEACERLEVACMYAVKGLTA